MILNKLRIVTIFLIPSLYCISQEIDCPLLKGKILKNEVLYFQSGNPNKQIEIISDTNVVISSLNGKIINIINHGGLINVIQKSNDYYYVYQNLESTNVSEGDLISKNSIIGFAKLENDNNFRLVFRVSDGDNPIKYDDLVSCGCQ